MELGQQHKGYLQFVLIKNMKKNAFTLFELLVSISIIAILTAIASLSFSGAQKKARDSRRISDMNSVQKAAEQYYSFSNYKYPLTSSGSWIADNGTTIMDIFPIDPKGIGYTAPTPALTTTAYCFCAVLENNIGNSTNQTCTSFVNGTGHFYCVKNQQ